MRSASASAETVRPADSSSAASAQFSFGLPSSRRRSPVHSSTGPSTRNSTSAPSRQESIVALISILILSRRRPARRGRAEARLRARGAPCARLCAARCKKTVKRRASPTSRPAGISPTARRRTPRVGSRAGNQGSNSCLFGGTDVSIISMAEWRKVPIGPDAARWSTRTQCATVLIVVDTVTSGQRLLEVARLFEGDVRVQVVFTSPVGGVFDNGVGEFLTGIGALVVPWRQAVESAFTLAVAAGHEGIHELHAPVVLLPHGAGFNKRVSAAQRGRIVAPRDVYGLGAQWLVRDGALVPSTLVLAHEEERDRLASSCPQALPAAVVVGDPCYDRIAASRSRRYAYRDALGVPPGCRLVTVASTWGPASLLGLAPDLPGRLVAELPRDEYQVIVLAHPNAWFGHGRWQITAWLTGALRGGLGLVPPEADWRAVLVASDVVIG